MSDWPSSITTPLLTGVLPLAGLTVVGLLLWTAGRRVLRPALAAAGLLAGGAIGWTAASTLSQADIGVTLPAWSGAALAGLLLACLAALLYRLLVAAALALVIALASPAAVLTAAGAQGTLTGAEPAPEIIGTGSAEEPDGSRDDGFIDPGGPIIDEASTWLFPEPDPEPAPESARDATADRATIAPLFPTSAADRVTDARARLEPLVDRGRNWWDQVPPRLRPAIIGAALTGLVLGLLMGTLAPSFSASIVTAFGGSLLWLCAFHALLLQIGAESPIPMTASTLTLAIWLSVSLLGAAIQWTFRPKPADTPR